jgi:uncharacterized protein YkwD
MFLRALSTLSLLTLCGVACGPQRSAAPVARPSAPVALDEAREYVLSLVNRDRAEHGLNPVEWDDTAAKAGQRHAEDMAKHGFTAHWGTDGSVPEQRYTEAGGSQFVQENAGCFAEVATRELDPNPKFDAKYLEQIEAAFINEKPPHDGHRKNILKPSHTHFGVGLAKVRGVDLPCMAQEFVDVYGEYADLPKTVRAGQNIEVSGDVHAPFQFGGVGIGKMDPVRPLTPKYLATTSVYRIPEPQVLYFPKGFKTPKVVEVDGTHFSIEVPLGKKGQPGRYAVSIWGKAPDSGNELVMISLRTILAK